MDQHSDLIFIRHVKDAIEKLNRYTEGISEDVFTGESLIQDGVIRQLEIIGEALRKVGHEFRIKYPEVAWEEIIGMRSKLIHDYFGVDIKRVWLVIKKDIPVLEKQIDQILSEG